MTIDPEYGVITSAEVGETVWDDLTRCNARIVRKERDKHGNLGYYLDSDWLDGGRFPWEISPPQETGFGSALLKREGASIPYDAGCGPELSRWEWIRERAAFRWARMKARLRWWLA